jgi:hypothetical protein
MKEDPSLEQPLKEWIDFFSDPASSLFTLGKGNLSESAYSESLYLALWLEFFLVAGEEQVKKKWALLPLEEQTGLGIELLKCFLFQPLYIRLSKEEKSSAIKSPLKLESQGKLFRVEHGSGTNRKIEFLYPLDHYRFWPDLFRVFPEDFFSSEKILKALEPGIIMASSSRLGKIRQRAETLGSFFLKSTGTKIPSSPLPEEQSNIDKNGLFADDSPDQTEGIVHSFEMIAPVQFPPMTEENKPSPSSPKREKKKRRSSKDQMELF